jgi:inorganic phosphate transporter, PiT family
MLIFLLATAFFLSFANGANDNFKGFATVWGSQSLSYRTALTLATLATIAGGIASVIIAEGLIKQFSGKGLVSDALANSPPFALAVAGGAGITIMAATRLGFPISTTHALVGGLTGAGLASSEAVNFGKLGTSFFLPLLTSPLISATVGFLVFYALRRSMQKTQAVKPPEFRTKAQPGKFAHAVHMASAIAICFARGVNDAPKLAALLLASKIFGPAGSALSVTAAMALGGLLLSRRVAETMSQRICKLEPSQGTAANIITAIMVLGASRLSLPVSTTHVSVGSIIGTGGAANSLDWPVVRAVLLSWVITLPCAALCAALIAKLI